MHHNLFVELISLLLIRPIPFWILVSIEDPMGVGVSVGVHTVSDNSTSIGIVCFLKSLNIICIFYFNCLYIDTPCFYIVIYIIFNGSCITGEVDL